MKEQPHQNSQPKTVFLFGAGASYGSDTLGTPPLGPGLFDELQRFNPDGWGTIAGKIATEFRSDFEEAMKLIASHALAPLQRAMAAYFFQFTPRTSNLYFELANRITGAEGWLGAACTLNYERLLELSLFRNGIQPFSGDPPADSIGLELCLPHGCCHIFCDSVKGVAGEVTFDGFSIQTDGPVTVVGDRGEHRTRILQDSFPPVMSFFEPNKRTTTGRSFIETQRARWRELAANADVVLIIGVRVRPHDDHIWDPIADAEARLVYCGGPTGASEYRSWAAATRLGRSDRVLEGYFREEFDVICEEAGLYER